MSEFTERLRDYGPTLGEHVIIHDRRVVDEAADIIDELEATLQWFIDNDETNEGDAPMAKYGGKTWDELNEYWINGLNRGRNALSRLRSL